MTETTGIDRPRVVAWLRRHVDHLVDPIEFELIAGGRSNLTFEVRDAAGHRWALRRPPTGHVLQSAHDMGREHRIIDALQHTSVPVPTLVGLCDDEAVNGAPFYVMDFVPGVIVRDLPATDAIPLDARRAMGESLVDTLVALHEIEPAEVGLGDLGKRGDYVARQLRRWLRQIDEGSDRPLAGLRALHARLEGDMPDQQGAGIVHGDYRLDNCMMDPSGPVAAVLDWELCTLGDVLADLGGLVMWWGDPDAGHVMSDVPTVATGFPTTDEVIDRYAARSGRDLSALPYYVAFSTWRLACITEGVRIRYEKGAMGDQESNELVDYLGERIDRLADSASIWLARIGA
ncbi:MAG: phosphotransferase family protein [Acidimicrobiia bacterium]|nr:phosphotransferase family protein [Acidimicrobiia bacterium]